MKMNFLFKLCVMSLLCSQNLLMKFLAENMNDLELFVSMIVLSTEKGKFGTNINVK